MNQTDTPEDGPAAPRVFSIDAGWALDLTAQIDDAAPGFMAHVCRARLPWRQALWAALSIGAATDEVMLFRATGDQDDLSGTPTQIMAGFALAAKRMTARDLTEVAFGSCPDGWQGALQRLHGQPLKSRHAYATLFGFYDSHSALDRARRAAIAGLPVFDHDQIEALAATSRVGLISAGLAARLRGARAARQLEADANTARALCSWLTDSHISEQASKPTLRDRPSWLRTVTAKADRLCPDQHPCDADLDLERFPVGKAKSVGLEFGNCLEPFRILPKALSGVWAMVLWREEKLLIETRMSETGQWHVERIHRANNRRVERAHIVAVRERLLPLGVITFVPALPEKRFDRIGQAWGGWQEAEFAAFELCE